MFPDVNVKINWEEQNKVDREANKAFAQKLHEIVNESISAMVQKMESLSNKIDGKTGSPNPPASRTLRETLGYPAYSVGGNWDSIAK